MQVIFVGIAVFYGIMITLMCWRVKEGEYPPPEQEDHSHWWSGVKNYARECFGCGYFWWVFLAYSCVVWSNLSNAFMVFFFRDEIGFSLDAFGKLMAMGLGIAAIVAYPAGILVDRWGSHKTLIASQMAIAVVCVLAFLTIHDKWSAGIWLIALFLCNSLPQLAVMKWTVDVYPRERYGQFGSAGAMFSSLGAVLLSLLCGGIMDWFKIYRFFWLWIAAFTLLGAAMAMIVYRKQNGRLQHC